MPGLNYFIKANKEEEKRLYRIMTELKLDGESYIENACGPEWKGTMMKFGIRAKPLIEKELLEPIWTHRVRGDNPTGNRLIRKKKSVKIEEVSKGSTSLFFFKPEEISIDMPKKRRRLI